MSRSQPGPGTRFPGGFLRLISSAASVLLVMAMSVNLIAQQPASSPETTLVQQEGELPAGALFAKVQELIANGEIRDASAEIDKAVAAGDARHNSADIHRSRRLVGLAFTRIKNVREAWDEQKKLLDYELADLSDPVSLGQLPVTLLGIAQLGVPIERQSETYDACVQAEKLVAALAANGPVGTAREVLSKIRYVKSNLLVQMKEPETALKVLEDDRAQLAELVAANEGDRLVLGLYMRTLAQLTGQTRDFDKRDALLAEQQDIIAREIKAQPGKPEFTQQLLTLIATRIQMHLTNYNSGGKSARDWNPAETMELVTTGRAAIVEFFAANPAAEQAMKQFEAQFEQLASVVENQARVPSLIGTKAVPLIATTWINGDAVSEEDRAGKVVLLDFWAAWIAPTPGVLAYNKALKDKYADDGLQVIGVTRYFNIRWNFTNEVPQLSQEPVPPEEENDALTLFLQKNKASWPTMIIDDETQIQEKYAVSVLPHCVLIDRKGNIRLIKVGFDQAIAAEIEITIKELLEEEN